MSIECLKYSKIDSTKDDFFQHITKDEICYVIRSNPQGRQMTVGHRAVSMKPGEI